MLDFADLPIAVQLSLANRLLDRMQAAGGIPLEWVAAIERRSIRDVWADVCEDEGIEPCNLSGRALGVIGDRTFSIH